MTSRCQISFVERPLFEQFPRHTIQNKLLLKQAPNFIEHPLPNQLTAENASREWRELLPRSDLTAEEDVIRNIMNRRGPGGNVQGNFANRGPTPKLLAARRAVSKHLLVFRGEAEIWPLFKSCYEYTTAACDFTNTDNLNRLQDSLQRLAKEAVQSRLLISDSVPELRSNKESAKILR